MNSAADPHAARLTIDYPDRDLDRVSTALRLVYAIPVMIVLVVVAGGVAGDTARETGGSIGAFGGGVLVLPVLLMIVFRGAAPGARTLLIVSLIASWLVGLAWPGLPTVVHTILAPILWRICGWSPTWSPRACPPGDPSDSHPRR